MRTLWFIPQGVRRIGPEEYTDYQGGIASTLTPISKRQAAAVIAQGGRRARELVSLLEGLGFEPELDGSETWDKASLVGEGFNRFDKGFNGRIHQISARFSGPPIEFDDLVRRFAAMPATVVTRTREDSSAKTRELEVLLDDRYGHSARIDVQQRKDSGLISARLQVTSRAFFYRWDKRDAVWSILARGRGENLEEQQAREIERLGFRRRRSWPVHDAPSGGLLESEAAERIRLYLVGAGVDADAMSFTPQRRQVGWDVAIAGGPTAALDALHITDDGHIGPREH
ncbi:hypothetical protein [Nocardia tengchongensis]|uniref:hypothetical protein n=1 Tax=Nocardia tengchongensis TaxID=2055889 RepID=UPI00367698D1